MALKGLSRPEQAAFESTRAGLLPRPWAVDDLDRLLDIWERKRYHKALIFVDNAGSDIVLGEALPDCRRSSGPLHLHFPFKDLGNACQGQCCGH
jgi:hypothetical protein